MPFIDLNNTVHLEQANERILYGPSGEQSKIGQDSNDPEFVWSAKRPDSPEYVYAPFGKEGDGVFLIGENEMEAARVESEKRDLRLDLEPDWDFVLKSQKTGPQQNGLQQTDLSPACAHQQKFVSLFDRTKIKGIVFEFDSLICDIEEMQKNDSLRHFGVTEVYLEHSADLMEKFMSSKPGELKSVMPDFLPLKDDLLKSVAKLVVFARLHGGEDGRAAVEGKYEVFSKFNGFLKNYRF